MPSPAPCCDRTGRRRRRWRSKRKKKRKRRKKRKRKKRKRRKRRRGEEEEEEEKTIQLQKRQTAKEPFLLLLLFLSGSNGIQKGRTRQNKAVKINIKNMPPWHSRHPIFAYFPKICKTANIFFGTTIKTYYNFQ